MDIKKLNFNDEEIKFYYEVVCAKKNSFSDFCKEIEKQYLRKFNFKPINKKDILDLENDKYTTIKVSKVTLEKLDEYKENTRIFRKRNELKHDLSYDWLISEILMDKVAEDYELKRDVVLLENLRDKLGLITRHSLKVSEKYMEDLINEISMLERIIKLTPLKEAANIKGHEDEHEKEGIK